MPHGAGLSATVPNANSLKARTPPQSGALRNAAMALASTGRMRPSLLFIGGFPRNRSLLHAELAKSTRAISPMTASGPDNRQVVIDPLAFGHVPFEKSDEGSPTAQVRGKFGTSDP